MNLSKVIFQKENISRNIKKILSPSISIKTNPNKII